MAAAAIGAPVLATEEWSLVFLTGWSRLGLVIALCAAFLAVALVLWGYRRERRPGVLAILSLTRIGAVGAVVLLVLQPAAQVRSVSRVPNHVAVLVDVSRSMAIRDQAQGPSRLERASALLARSRERFDLWRKEKTVTFYAFGSELRELPTSPVAADAATHTEEALSDLAQDRAHTDLAGLIVISDGADNGRLGKGDLSPAARSLLARLKAPVHTVLVGSPEIRDLSIADLFVDDFAFVRNAVRVDVDLHVLGYPGQPITVTLEGSSGVLATRRVQASEARARKRVRFEFVPPEVGMVVYTVKVPVQPGEALTENNQRSFVQKVIRDRVRVLQLCGRPSWDTRFLRHLLKQDPNVDLISFFILRTPTDISQVDSSELSLIPFPTEELFERELGSFDLVIMQNFNYSPYGIGGYLPQLRSYVEEGGALLMMGGDLSFASGGYSGSVLAPVLPMQLPEELFDPERLLSVEEFHPRLTREGRDHPIMQLADLGIATESLLRTLPPLDGCNLVEDAGPGATVLLDHPRLRTRSGASMPVLSVREAGKGRTLAFTSDSSWRWAFAEAAPDLARRAYERLWRNAIRFLIRDPELSLLRVIAEKDQVAQGNAIKVVLRAYQPDFQPAKGLEATYQVVPPKGASDPAGKGTLDERGEYMFSFKPNKNGIYRVRASVRINGRETTSEAIVLVMPDTVEQKDPAARPAPLQALARATGGRYLGAVDTLPDLPLREPRVQRVNWQRDLELWNRWWSLLTALALLGIDWLLRRKWGYL